MKKNYVLFALLVLFGLPAFSQTLVSFDFNSCECAGNFTATPAANLQSPVSFTRGNGLTSNAGGGVYNSKGWNGAISLATAQSGNKYHDFSIAPASGYQVTYTQVNFPQQASSTGPDEAQIGYSTDGGVTWTYSGVQPVPASLANFTWNFPDFTTSATVIFRVWSWKASNPSSAGTYRNDNVILSGSVSAIPVVNPSVTTSAATGVTSSSISFAGTVNANGDPASASFNYGFAIPYSSSVAAVPATVTGNSVTSISAIVTGLTPNTLYNYQASATNSNSTATGSNIAIYTLANTPLAPVVNGVTSSSLNVTPNASGNPAITAFAIFESSTGLYVQADGSLGNGPVWQTAAEWNSPVTVTGLAAGTPYTFGVIAVNGDGIETSAGATTTLSTAVGVPLAVQFGNITAQLTPAGNYITWINHTESDIASYTVERSTDGQVFSGVYTTLPLSNNSGPASYSWTDRNAMAGLYYYRIKATETNGRTVYSIAVKVAGQASISELHIFPNPVKDRNIAYQLVAAAPGSYTVALYASNGNRLTSRATAHAGGTIAASLAIPGNSPGLYFLQLTDETGRIITTKKIIVP